MAFTCIDDAVQSIDCLFALLFETLILLQKHNNVTHLLSNHKIIDFENILMDDLKGCQFLSEKEIESFPGLSAASCKERIHRAASSELVTPSYEISNNIVIHACT